MEQEDERGNIQSTSSSFDIDLFFDHVYNAAYDIFEDSFDTLEESVPLLLKNLTEDTMKATTLGFNRVFDIVQETLDKNLNRWEEYSRANCFVNINQGPMDHEGPHSSSSDVDSSLEQQEDRLDAELESVRSQLLSAGKESAKLRREYRNLERCLTVKKQHEAAFQDAMVQLKDDRHQNMLEELVRVASLLQEKLKMVKPDRMQSPRGVRWTASSRPDLDIISLEGVAKMLNY